MTQEPEAKQPKGQNDPNIILSNSGQPFKTEGAAKSARATKGLAITDWDVQPHEQEGGGVGFAIIRKNFGMSDTEEDVHRTPAEKEAAAIKAKLDSTSETEKFYWVRFHDKTNQQDPDHVELGVNGEVLKIQRNKWVILPARFLECARHAVHPHFQQVPGQPRKQVGTLVTWPHDVRQEHATRGQYAEMLAEGTKADRASYEAAAAVSQT